MPLVVGDAEEPGQLGGLDGGRAQDPSRHRRHRLADFGPRGRLVAFQRYATSCDLSSLADAVKKHILHVGEVIRTGEGDSQSSFLAIVSHLKLVLEMTKRQIAAQIQQEGMQCCSSGTSDFGDKKIKESTTLLKSL